MRVENATSYFPQCTQQHVRSALQWFSPLDLAGIETIKLMDEPPLTAGEKNTPIYLRNVISGGYVKKQSTQKAYIMLFTRQMYLGLPLPLKFTPLATLQIAQTLAHEVGHHLIATRGYIDLPTEEYRSRQHREKSEMMCDSYAYDVVRRMSSQWRYRISLRLCRILSNLHYDHGIVVWENREYERAAYYWACSYVLNPDNVDALHGYKKALTALKIV